MNDKKNNARIREKTFYVRCGIIGRTVSGKPSLLEITKVKFINDAIDNKILNLISSDVKRSLFNQKEYAIHEVEIYIQRLYKGRVHNLKIMIHTEDLNNNFKSISEKVKILVNNAIIFYSIEHDAPIFSRGEKEYLDDKLLGAKSSLKLSSNSLSLIDRFDNFSIAADEFMRGDSKLWKRYVEVMTYYASLLR